MRFRSDLPEVTWWTLKDVFLIIVQPHYIIQTLLKSWGRIGIFAGDFWNEDPLKTLERAVFWSIDHFRRID